MPLTEKQLRELSLLAKSAELTVFLGVVESRRADALERLLNAATAEETFRLQGRVKALDELIKDMRGAPQTAARSAGSRTPAAGSF